MKISNLLGIVLIICSCSIESGVASSDRAESLGRTAVCANNDEQSPPVSRTPLEARPRDRDMIRPPIIPRIPPK